MTQAIKHEATVLYRVSIKRNGLTIYVVEGSAQNYYVTLSSRGTISSCVDSGDNTCKGFLYNHGNCKHVQAVEAKMAEQDEKRSRENNYCLSMGI